MSQAGEGRERRRRPRIAVKGDVLGRIHTVSGAPVLNISENGALLEASAALRPGTIYMLRLSLTGDLHLNLKTRVVRTYVHSFQSKATSESTVTYHAALEFIDLSDQNREILKSHIDSLKGNMDVEFQ